MKPWTLAWRSLVRRPGFVLAVVVILALGIGANTAIFSLVDTVLLKPLPYPNADRLATVQEASSSKSDPISLIAPGRLEDWNRRNRTFEAIAGLYTENVTDTSGVEPERLAARRVSPRYFAVYGTRAAAGRTFTPDEEVDGGPASAVISYDLWTRRYHQDPCRRQTSHSRRKGIHHCWSDAQAIHQFPRRSVDAGAIRRWPAA